jgi:hypothetical protein
MIFSLNFLEGLECALGVIGNILMSRISWNLFGNIWIQNVGNIDFKVNYIAINSNKFQKTRFWKEISMYILHNNVICGVHLTL